MELGFGGGKRVGGSRGAAFARGRLRHRGQRHRPGRGVAVWPRQPRPRPPPGNLASSSRRSGDFFSLSPERDARKRDGGRRRRRPNPGGGRCRRLSGNVGRPRPVRPLLCHSPVRTDTPRSSSVARPVAGLAARAVVRQHADGAACEGGGLRARPDGPAASGEGRRAVSRDNGIAILFNPRGRRRESSRSGGRKQAIAFSVSRVPD